MFQYSCLISCKCENKQDWEIGSFPWFQEESFLPKTSPFCGNLQSLCSTVNSGCLIHWLAHKDTHHWGFYILDIQIHHEQLMCWMVERGKRIRVMRIRGAIQRGEEVANSIHGVGRKDPHCRCSPVSGLLTDLVIPPPPHPHCSNWQCKSTGSH